MQKTHWPASFSSGLTPQRGEGRRQPPYNGGIFYFGKKMAFVLTWGGRRREQLERRQERLSLVCLRCLGRADFGRGRPRGLLLEGCGVRITDLSPSLSPSPSTPPPPSAPPSPPPSTSPPPPPQPHPDPHPHLHPEPHPSSMCGAGGALTLVGGEAGAPRPAGAKSGDLNGFPSFAIGGGRGDAAASQRAMPDLAFRVWGLGCRV